MSTYQELKGLKVKYLSSDTSGDRVKEGEVFYNSTDFNIKSFVASSAWHSGSNLIVARRGPTGTGTQTAALASGGGTPNPATVATEEYNGTGWVVRWRFKYRSNFCSSSWNPNGRIKIWRSNSTKC
jgi:hypothetical protein